MTLGDEAMRWVYAVSLRSSRSAGDAALLTLLAVFLVVVWRLAAALFRQHGGPVTPTIRTATRPDGARASAGTPLRPPGPMHSARVLGGERRSIGGS